jgi:hypothetical protein
VADRGRARRVAAAPGKVRPLDEPEPPAAVPDPSPPSSPAPPPAAAPDPAPPASPAPAPAAARPPLDLEASRRALEERQQRWMRLRAAWQERRDAGRRAAASSESASAADAEATKP